MSHRAWIDPRIDSVRVSNVRSYLLTHGWKQEPFPGPELLVFGGPVDDDGQAIVQVLPSSERMRDYRMRLEELIEALSAFEDRSPQDVLVDILKEPPLTGVPQTGQSGASAEIAQT
jgi:hypothetical protein